jgi:hypothetical protein
MWALGVIASTSQVVVYPIGAGESRPPHGTAG